MRTKSLTVRLHRSEYDALLAASKNQRRSMAEIVRRALRAELRSEQPSLPFDAVLCEHPLSVRWQGQCLACGDVLSRLGDRSAA